MPAIGYTPSAPVAAPKGGGAASNLPKVAAPKGGLFVNIGHALGNVSSAVQAAAKTASAPVSPRQAYNIAKTNQLIKADNAPAISPKQAAAHSGGGLLGAITDLPLVHGAMGDLASAASDLASGAGHVAGNLGKDLIEMPLNVGKGAVSMAGAVYDDLTHGNLGVLNFIPGVEATNPNALHDIQNSESLSLAANSVKGDPIYQALTGHPDAALNTLYQHPLTGILDAAGGYGLAGKGAGMAARAGALGDRAQAAAQLARDDRTLVPGFMGEHQTYSPNIATAAIQRYMETNHPQGYEQLQTAKSAAAHPIRTVRDLKANGGKLTSDAVQHLLQRVDEFVPTEKAREAQAIQETAQQLHDSMPKNRVAQNLVPHMAMGVVGGHGDQAVLDSVEQMLHSHEQAIVNHHTAGDLMQHGIAAAAHDPAGALGHLNTGRDLLEPYAQGHLDRMLAQGAPDQRGLDAVQASLRNHQLSDEALTANGIHQGNLREFLVNPDIPAASTAAREYVARQIQLDEKAADMGLRDSSQQERRALEPYAVAHMDAQNFTRSLRSPLSYKAAELRDALGAAAKDYATIRNETKLEEARAQVEDQRQRRALEATAAKAKTQEVGATKFSTGRYGQSRTRAYKGGTFTLDGDLSVRRLPTDPASRISAGQAARSVAEDQLARGLEQLRQLQADRRAYASRVLDAKKAARDDLAIQYRALGGRSALSDSFKGLAVKDPQTDRWRPLSNEEIKAHMEGNGIDSAAYVRQQLPSKPPKGLWGKASRGVTNRHYTGRGLKAGAWTPGYGALAKSQLGSVRAIERATTQDNLVNQFGMKQEDGQYFTPDSARNYAAEYARQHPDAPPLVAVYAHPQALTEAQHATIHGIQDPVAAEHAMTRDAFANRRVLEEDIHGSKEHVVLMSEPVIDRYNEHLAEPSGAEKALMGVNRVFRNSVLTPSSKWYTQVATEAGLRSLMAGVNPLNAARYYRLADRTIDRMRENGLEPEAQRLENMTMRGRNYGLQYQRNLEDIGARTTRQVGPFTMDTSHLIQDSRPAVSGARQALRTIHDKYYAVTQNLYKVNKWVESKSEQTILGQHMAKYSGITKDMTQGQRAMTDYMDRLAQGYSDVRLAENASRYVNSVLGQYNHFSPAEKRFISTIAPFWPWYRNATRFMYYTLPHGHPLLTTALNQVGQTVSPAWSQSHTAPEVPFAGGLGFNDLNSFLKTSPNSYVNVERFTPVGAFTSGPLDYGLNAVAPQFQGILHNLYGQDAFGGALKGPNGPDKSTGSRMWLALNSALQELAGPTNDLLRVVEYRGSTPYNTSTWFNPQVKPNSVHAGGGILGGLKRVFDPFEPTLYSGKSGTGAGALGAGAGSAGGGAGTLGAGAGSPK